VQWKVEFGDYIDGLAGMRDPEKIGKNISCLQEGEGSIEAGDFASRREPRDRRSEGHRKLTPGVAGDAKFGSSRSFAAG